MAKKTKYPERSKDVPVTQKMLFIVRDELTELIKSEARRTDSNFHNLRSDIHGVKSDVHGLKSEVHGMKSEVHGMKSDVQSVKSEIQGLKSDIHSMKSEIHRIALLVEEQNARNAIVMDGLTNLFERQERLERSKLS